MCGRAAIHRPRASISVLLFSSMMAAHFAADVPGVGDLLRAFLPFFPWRSAELGGRRGASFRRTPSGWVFAAMRARDMIPAHVAPRAVLLGDALAPLVGVLTDLGFRAGVGALAVLDQRHRVAFSSDVPREGIDLVADDVWQVIERSESGELAPALMMRERARIRAGRRGWRGRAWRCRHQPASAGDSSIILARRGLNERSRSSSVGITHSRSFIAEVVHQVANPVEHGLCAADAGRLHEGYLAHAGMLRTARP